MKTKPAFNEHDPTPRLLPNELFASVVPSDAACLFPPVWNLRHRGPLAMKSLDSLKRAELTPEAALAMPQI